LRLYLRRIRKLGLFALFLRLSVDDQARRVEDGAVQNRPGDAGYRDLKICLHIPFMAGGYMSTYKRSKDIESRPPTLLREIVKVFGLVMAVLDGRFQFRFGYTRPNF